MSRWRWQQVGTGGVPAHIPSTTSRLSKPSHSTRKDRVVFNACSLLTRLRRKHTCFRFLAKRNRGFCAPAANCGEAEQTSVVQALLFLLTRSNSERTKSLSSSIFISD